MIKDTQAIRRLLRTIWKYVNNGNVNPTQIEVQNPSCIEEQMGM